MHRLEMNTVAIGTIHAQREMLAVVGCSEFIALPPGVKDDTPPSMGGPRFKRNGSSSV